MIKDLTSLYYERSPLVIPQWENYIDTLRPLREIFEERFLSHEYSFTDGTRFLAQLINIVDMDNLHTYEDDFDRYLNYFEPMQNVLDTAVMGSLTGIRHKGMFFDSIGSNYTTSEFIFPIIGLNYLKTLPLNEDFESWKSVKPFTIWYHDSPEYTMNVLSSKIKFTGTAPTYAVMFVDPIGICFKWYKYWADPEIPDEEKDPQIFIHKYVLPFIFDDLLDIFLLNQLGRVIHNVSNDIDDNYKAIDPSLTFGYTGDRYTAAMRVLDATFKKMKRVKIHPERILNSQLLDNKSLRDRFEFGNEYLPIPNLNQYKYIELLKDIQSMYVLFSLYATNPKSSYYKNMIYSVKHVVRKMVGAKVNKRIKDRKTKELVMGCLEYVATETGLTISKW